MAIKVITHELDEDAGVYRLVFGTEVFEELSVTDPDDAERRVIGYEAVEEILWAADDERWFDGKKRRSHKEVAAEQRKLVKRQLDARARDAEQRAVRAEKIVGLPGAGGAL